MLSEKDKALLRNLIRKEAKSLGYDTQYNEFNRSEWPSRLKDLRRVIQRIK